MSAVLLLAATALASRVTVQVLEGQHLASARLAGHSLVAERSLLRVDGRPGEGVFRTGSGRWTVEAEGLSRRYEGSLTVEAKEGRLVFLLDAPLESYVAGVVASESDPGTPRAALEALAVIARSYALSGRDLCDLTHCETFHGMVAGEGGEEARDAAQATAGEVLRLDDGTIARATFHAACGGHTADPRLVFGGEEKTGARAVPDVDEPEVWTARVSEADWRSVLRELFADPLLEEEPGLVRSGDGRIVQLILGDGRVAAGDAFTRALDRSLGRGQVRSSRFEVELAEGGIVLRGSGHGHGVGLCQAGARLRAMQGESAREILSDYFPAARLSR